jgi:hypothetical protein
VAPLKIKPVNPWCGGVKTRHIAVCISAEVIRAAIGWPAVEASGEGTRLSTRLTCTELFSTSLTQLRLRR